jgi:NADH-quinone oxidoreductase subunit H
MLEVILWALLKSVVLFLGFVLSGGAILTWVERRMSARIQDRVGPNRANIGKFRFWGLLHPIADAVKMFLKEDLVPNGADRFLFFVAPLISFAPALIVFVVIPFGPPIAGTQWLMVSDVQMGLLFLLAVGSLGIYGQVLAGWSSNNKWSLLGSARTVAQLFSYEAALTLSILGLFMVYGTVAPQEIITLQQETWFGWLPKWGVFTQPLAFILFLFAFIAESKRAPFDLPEADSELVAGYNTEYSAMRFALFYLSEFVGILVIGAVGAVLFFGGWHVPGLAGEQWWVILIQVGAFLLKVGALVYLQMLIRWTLPRMRYDQVMNFSWKGLLPFGMANVLVTALVLTLWP